MKLYLDIHNKVDGLTPQALAEAHERDLQVQGKHGVNYLKYWYNEDLGKIFCLAEAPSRDALDAVHREAQGVGADEIIEVREGK